MADRTPVIVLDRVGYRYYQNQNGRRFLPAEHFDVRLVTERRKLAVADGAELESAVGVALDDEPVVDEAVRFQHRFGGRPAEFLVTVSEPLLVPAARLRGQLGLPGMSVEQTLRFRDKVVMKQYLREHGIRVPDFAPFTEQAVRRLGEKHSRLFLKPRMGSGSMKVRELRGAADAARFTSENAGALDQFEVEEYIAGQLYHVDSVVVDGRVVAATAGRTVDPTTSYRDALPCRDVGVAPGPDLDRLLDFNADVLSCHRDFTGVTHHEVFLCDDEPVFCEIAARAGGGGIVAGFHSRTGVNLDEMVVRAQVDGVVPTDIQLAAHLTGYVLIYAEHGILREPIVTPDEPWIIESQIRAAVGDTVRRPQVWGGAVAIVTVRGTTEAEILARLDRVVELMSPRIERRPLPAAR